MKQLLAIASALLILASCGNGTPKASSNDGGQTKTEKATKSSSIKLGDKFAFAGLDLFSALFSDRSVNVPHSYLRGRLIA